MSQPTPMPKELHYVVLRSPDGFRFPSISVYPTSMTFDTTDQEGGNEDGFELTYEEVYAACKQYMEAQP